MLREWRGASGHIPGQTPSLSTQESSAQKLHDLGAMEKLLRKLLSTVGGVILCIAIWTIQDRIRSAVGGGSDSADSIPQEVWGGGGGVVTLEVEASEPAIVSATFETNKEIDDSGHDYLETSQEIEAGTHTFDIAVPTDISGSVFLRVDNPSIGAKIKMALLVDGKPVWEESARLDEPLEAGYGFATGITLDDYAAGRLSED